MSFTIIRDDIKYQISNHLIFLHLTIIDKTSQEP